MTNGSIPVQVVATNLPWVFTSGSPLGELAGASLTLNMPSVPCTTTIISPGDVSDTYTTGAPSILNLDDDDLEVSNSFCPLLFAPGDDSRFLAQYEISQAGVMGGWRTAWPRTVTESTEITVSR